METGDYTLWGIDLSHEEFVMTEYDMKYQKLAKEAFNFANENKG